MWPSFSTLAPTTIRSVNFNAITLDHRIREQLVGHLGGERPGLHRLGGGEVELEILALAHVFDLAVAERVQRVGDRLALRVEDRRFERDEDTSAHQPSREIVRPADAV